jgi:hypothetical protein
VNGAAAAPPVAAAAPAPLTLANELRKRTTDEAMRKRAQAVGRLNQKTPAKYERKNLQLMTNIKEKAKAFEKRREEKRYNYMDPPKYKGGRKRTTVNKRLHKRSSRRSTYRR